MVDDEFDSFRESISHRRFRAEKGTYFRLNAALVERRFEFCIVCVDVECRGFVDCAVRSPEK